MERPVRERSACPAALTDRYPRGAGGDLHLAISDLSLAAGGGTRAAGRALRALWRHLPALRLGVQHLCCRHGRVYRAVWHGGADRCGDGDLFGGGRGAQAPGPGGTTDPGSPAGGRDRGGAAAAAPEGDDGLDRGGGPAAHYVEPFHRGGGHEAAGDTGTRGDGQLPDACAARDPRDLLLAPGAGAPSRGGEGRRRDRPCPPWAAGARIGRWTQCLIREEKQLMKRMMMGVVLGVVLLTGFSLEAVWGADLKVIQTHKTKDVIVTLLSEPGQWTKAKNTFVLEFTSASTKQPVEAGKVTLSTSMSMPGMAPMLAGATLSPDKVPGRYLGTISFPDSGARQVTVAWDGPAGKGSTQFSVSVR